MRKSFLGAVVLCVLATAAMAQDSSRSIGITASLQSTQTDLLVPLWISDRAVVAPAIGLSSVADVATSFDVGFNFRYYLKSQIVATYLGFRFGALITTPSSGSSSTDLLFGPMFGGEYFLHPHFSLGVEAQLNIIKSDENSNKFGSPGKLSIATGSAVFASYYF